MMLFGLELLLALLVYLQAFFQIGRSWWWYETLLCFSLSFGLIALCCFFFGKTSRIMLWIAPQSYAAYLVHIFVILGLEYHFDRVPMGGGTGKFLFVGVMASALV